MILNSVCMSRAADPHRISQDRALQTRLLLFLSAAMMLRYSFDLDKEADAVENAVKQVLKDGYRTGLISCPQEEDKKSAVEQVGTSRMGRSDLRENIKKEDVKNMRSDTCNKRDAAGTSQIFI